MTAKIVISETDVDVQAYVVLSKAESTCLMENYVLLQNA
jgi:hypothetical protein